MCGLVGYLGDISPDAGALPSGGPAGAPARRGSDGDGLPAPAILGAKVGRRPPASRGGAATSPDAA
ncbi:MAG: hypothetical protein PGN34_08845 [Methylobacterium frigidaeris]